MPGYVNRRGKQSWIKKVLQFALITAVTAIGSTDFHARDVTIADGNFPRTSSESAAIFCDIACTGIG